MSAKPEHVPGAQGVCQLFTVDCITLQLYATLCRLGLLAYASLTIWRLQERSDAREYPSTPLGCTCRPQPSKITAARNRGSPWRNSESYCHSYPCYPRGHEKLRAWGQPPDSEQPPPRISVPDIWNDNGKRHQYIASASNKRISA